MALTCAVVIALSLCDPQRPNDYTFSGLITAQGTIGSWKVTELRQLMVRQVAKLFGVSRRALRRVNRLSLLSAPSGLFTTTLHPARSSRPGAHFASAHPIQADHGVRETVHTYNALIAAYDRVGDYDRAMALFKQLPAIGVAPNATTMQLVCALPVRGRAAAFGGGSLVFLVLRASACWPPMADAAPEPSTSHCSRPLPDSAQMSVVGERGASRIEVAQQNLAAFSAAAAALGAALIRGGLL